MYLATLIAGIRFLHFHTSWSLADWLINYQGGFVRRGLLGEIALHLSRLLHIRPLLLVLAMGVLGYSVLFWSLYKLVQRVTWTWWTLLLFVSPVTVAFFVVSAIGYHKEVIFFAGMAFLLVRLRTGTFSDIGISLYIATLGVVGTLTHEPFVVYAPYVVAAVWSAIPDPRRLLKIGLLPCAVTAVALIAVVTHPGTTQTAIKICSSLGASNVDLCDGAIGYLGYDKQAARQDVLDQAAHFHYLRFFPILTLIALVPILGWFVTRWSRPFTRVIAACSLLSCTLCTALFLYGTDWGRWIQINLFSIFLLILAAESREDNPPLPRLNVRYLAVALYATCWSLPGYSDKPWFGYISMLGRFIPRYKHYL